MKTSEPVPLIEVIESRMPVLGDDGIVKFKGKLLDPKILTLCDWDYVEAEMPAEILFDFKAEELPDVMSLGVKMSGDECLGLLQFVTLTREKSYVEMDFAFEIDEFEPPKGDLNPHRILPAFTKAVKGERYKIKTYEGVCGFHILFPIPFSDNVYSHYKKHLAAFENLCTPIANEILKRLNKRYKSKQ